MVNYGIRKEGNIFIVDYLRRSAYEEIEARNRVPRENFVILLSDTQIKWALINILAYKKNRICGNLFRKRDWPPMREYLLGGCLLTAIGLDDNVNNPMRVISVRGELKANLENLLVKLELPKSQKAESRKRIVKEL